MSGSANNPQSVRIARKRGAEEPPETLVVRSQHEGQDGHTPAIYVRQQNDHKRRNVSNQVFGNGKAQNGGKVEFAPKVGAGNALRDALAGKLFELKVPATGKPSRKRGRDDVATFVEMKRERSQGPGAAEVDEREVEQYAAQERRYKRPSRQPRMGREEGEDEVGLKPQTDAERREMESLAQYLHEAALEEVELEKKQQRQQQQKEEDMNMGKVAVASPKISGQRARELHRKRVESNNKLASQVRHRQKDNDDVYMSDGDYIYDTYILATSITPSITTTNSSSSFTVADKLHALPPHSSDIGYLIISPEDQDTWAAYIDELPTTSDDEVQRNSDEEDENAEDYYGADYPEDELSEDDEFGRKAYGYRRGGEEESDGDGDGYESEDDAAVWSEGDGEMDEVERMMNPFKYHRGVAAGGVGRRFDGAGG